MLARIACFLSFVLSAGVAEAQPRPSLYVEGGGASGLYAVGAEHILFTSSDRAQHLAVRAGVGYWVESSFFLDDKETYLSVPVAATASFRLGMLPVRLETTGGIVFGYERNTLAALQTAGWDARALPFGEVAVRASLTRQIFARGGAVVGGRHDLVTGGPVAPVLGVGVQL